MSSTPTTAPAVDPEKVSGFQQIRDARRSIGAQGALTAVRTLLQQQHQERRAMHEALGLVAKHTPDAKEAMRLLELKEIPAPAPVDTRIAQLEARMMQLEAAALENADRIESFTARARTLETRMDLEPRAAYPPAPAIEDRIGDVEIPATVPVRLADPSRDAEGGIRPVDRRTLSTGEAA